MAKLGDRVKDRISGFVGIAVGRSEYLYGCVRLSVASTEMKDGKPIETQWFDEDQCEVVEGDAVPAPASAKTRAGGPMPAPTPRRDDSR